jgi:hypothetical protein
MGFDSCPASGSCNCAWSKRQRVHCDKVGGHRRCYRIFSYCCLVPLGLGAAIWAATFQGSQSRDLTLPMPAVPRSRSRLSRASVSARHERDIDCHQENPSHHSTSSTVTFANQSCNCCRLIKKEPDYVRRRDDAFARSRRALTSRRPLATNGGVLIGDQKGKRQPLLCRSPIAHRGFHALHRYLCAYPLLFRRDNRCDVPSQISGNFFRLIH